MATAGDDRLEALVGQVASRLTEAGWRLTTAESCTGGWIAKVCTDQAGSSRWFEDGLVTYSNASKQSRLGVPASTLEGFGAVSAETATAMAAGARAEDHQRVALATTGIAGPGGGSERKPVGLVWFAWAWPDGRIITDSAVFAGDRDAIRRESVAHALRGVLAERSDA